MGIVMTSFWCHDIQHNYLLFGFG